MLLLGLVSGDEHQQPLFFQVKIWHVLIKIVSVGKAANRGVFRGEAIVPWPPFGPKIFFTY